jgi:hypothetical protein
MLLGIIVFLLLIWVNLTVWGGEYIDSQCVKGRLKTHHARALNEHWTKAPVEKGDRIVARECSEFLRAGHLRDWDWWIPYRTWIQVHIFGGEI